tara:strand:+ start:3010 stop:4158 length:1149 start_codon:yes stop_codon:yes gene_type:complete
MKIKSSFGEKYKEYEIGDIVYLAKDKPLQLRNKEEISNFPMAYQAYGQLNEKKDNAILICHALTGDQYVASKNPITGKPGWWDYMVGEGKTIDTNKYFVICPNVIGGCLGSFGPKTVNEETGKVYGIDFPFLTIDDMVNAQKLLINEHFGIDCLHAIIGGSFGGALALTWSVLYPEMTKRIAPISTSYRHSPQNIAFHEVGRQAIMADSDWCNGDYISHGKHPGKGLAVARMTAHITYLSETSLQKKFGRNLQDKEFYSFHFKPDFQVESYLHYQGYSFVERFDANSYLYITKALDYFDLETDFNGNLSSAFVKTAKYKPKFCVISFSDDWLFPPSESKKLINTLISSNIDVSSITIESSSGHDSFLIENDYLKNIIAGFLS